MSKTAVESTLLIKNINKTLNDFISTQKTHEHTEEILINTISAILTTVILDVSKVNGEYEELSLGRVFRIVCGNLELSKPLNISGKIEI